jgi:signal transduction histidine kinase
MTLTAALHVTAGVACLVLGGASLLRDPSRRRNRLFAALSAALAIWTIGIGASLADALGPLGGFRPWLVGSCLAAPLGLHFALALTADRRRLPRGVLILAYGGAAALWAAATFGGLATRPWWYATAVPVLGAILLPAVARIAWHARRLPRGPQRRAQSFVAAAATIAILGGLSDFVPRDYIAIPRIGPIALLLFVLVVCAVVVRHRFLDIDRFLAAAAAWIAGSAAIALAARLVIGVAGASWPVLFGIVLVTLALARPIGTFVRAAVRESLRTGEPTVAALLEVSRDMAAGRSATEIWAILDDARRRLPAGVRAGLYLKSGETFRARIQAGDDDLPAELEGDDPLLAFLADDRRPVTLRYLDDEAREAGLERRERAAASAERLRSIRAQIAVPLETDRGLVGALVLGGLAPSALTADLAAAAQAIGNQALARFERADAVEDAERRRALAAVGEMAAGLAHEVRNPVAAIRGAAQALGPDATPEQAATMLRVIEEESERLGRFVGEFLDYARPSSPRLDPVDLAEVVRDAVRRAELAGLPLEISVDAPGRPPRTVGDADQIGRVVDNLVRNAAEAARGTTDAALRITLGHDGDRSVHARFEDNGPGIRDDDVVHLFRPFFTTKRGGTGLGLALAHRIVEAHGGRLDVERGRPRGAAFTVTLPAMESHDVA